MNKALLITLTTLLFFACKHDLEKPTWDVDMIAPLMHTNLTINDLIPDSNLLINEDEQGFISLVYEQNFIDVNYDSLLHINSTTDEKTIKIDSVKFDDVVIEQVTTLGSIISDLPGGTLFFPNGSQRDIPAMVGVIQNDTILIDASEYFETMTLYNGMLNIKLTNNFPTDISNVSFSLYNATNQDLIATFTSPLIASGTTYTESTSVADETLDHLMYGIINNIDVEASNGLVQINYADAIITNISITDIQIMEATAYFPNQLLHQENVELPFEFGSAKLTEIGIKTGYVSINAVSTLPDTASVIYSIPSFTKNGIPFETVVKIPPSSNGELSTFTFNFDGYKMDLTGEYGRIGGDTVNTIYTELSAYLDSTGELETIHKVDSFYMYNEFNIIPEYAIGYLGQDIMLIGPEEIDFNIFKSITVEKIDLEKVDLKLKFENYIGADASLVIKEFSTSNENTTVNAESDQNGNPIIGTIYNIGRGTLSGGGLPIKPNITEIVFDADEMLEILPNKVNTQATFYLNPNGQSNTDFLYTDFPINATMSIEIPLSFIATNLTLQDTNEISISDNKEVEIDKLFITIENSLPLGASIKLILLDEANQEIATLVDNAIIMAASTNNDGIVIENKTSTLEISNSDFSNAKKIISIAAFTTQPNNEFISIYSNYKMNITISAKFRKTLGN